MASIDINIGTAADSGNGDPLRTFATNVAAMFAEIYGLGTSESDLTTGTAFEITNARIASNAAIDMDKLDGDSLAGSITDFAQDDLVILSDTSDSGNLKSMTASNLEDAIFGNVSGDATIAAGGALTIANDSVEHAMLENRYTAKATSSTTGSQNIDASTATTFLLTGNVATATLTLQNMKLGQVIDIVLSGTLSSAAITLADDFTSSTIRRVGSTELDTSATNVITVTCIDDTDSAALIHYTINSFQTDTTP